MNQESILRQSSGQEIKNHGKLKNIIHDSLFMIHSRGFTLLELLVVIAVIGVLIGAAITLINPATYLKRGRDTQRKSDLSRIQSAIEIYRADLNAYPASLPGCGLSLTGGVPSNTYMTKVPCDPLSPPAPYLYSTNATFSTYCLRACLENTQDKGKDNPNNFACLGIAGCAAGRVSYTVISP